MTVPRSGHRRVDHASPLVDLDVVFADDVLVDSIVHPDPPVARKGARRAGMSDADPLMDLFRTWRHEVTAVPLPVAPDVRRAFETAGHRRKSGQRSLRPALAIAAAIAALLVGTATVGSRQASPDSALWAVTQVLWPDRAQSVASQQHVRDALKQAEAALKNGQTREAQLALLRAAMELGKIDEIDARVAMQAQLDQMWKETAPQEPSGGATAPEMLAGGPDGDVAAAVSWPASAMAPGGRTSAPSRASSVPTKPASPATAAPAAAGTSAATAGSMLPEMPAPGPATASPAGADPAQAVGANPDAAPPSASAAPSANQVTAPTAAAGSVPGPSSPSAPIPPETAPAAPTASPPAPVVDPGPPTTTAPALTPPPPGSTDPSTVPTSPDTTPPAAPPVPAPVPTTGTGSGQTDPATTANALTTSTETGQQASSVQSAADAATAAVAPSN